MDTQDIKIKNTDVIITSNTVINGGITTDSNVYIFGEVKGDVKTSESVTVHGRVEGQVAAKNLAIYSGSVSGNTTLSNNAEIADGAMLIGDLQAENLKLAGVIKGNLDIGKLTTFEVTAVCEGDIISALLNIKTGAKLTGSITIFDDSEKQKPTKEKKPTKLTETK